MNDTTSTALIQVTALPQIQESLRALRERWQQYAADAAALVCTEDTVQALKAQRADMRKEFEAADAQRKAAKSAYMQPWEAVEATYKECVAEAFKAADAALKGKIADFEGELKASAREALADYFDELCAVHGVDFLSLDTALHISGVSISLADAKSKSQRRLKDALNETVARVALDLERINDMDEEDRAEIAAEYKEKHDLGAAVATVHGRKRRIAAEKQAAEEREAARKARQEAAAVVAALAPAKPVEAPPERDEKRYTITFTVKDVTRAQAIALREFLKKEQITYE